MTSHVLGRKGHPGGEVLAFSVFLLLGTRAFRRRLVILLCSCLRARHITEETSPPGAIPEPPRVHHALCIRSPLNVRVIYAPQYD